MPITYTGNIPLSNQRIKDTRGPINNNFLAIQELIAVNHGNFNTANFGKHNFITFPAQTVAPTITATDIGLYGILTTPPAGPGLNQIRFIQPNGTTPYDRPMTSSSINGAAPINEQAGWAYTSTGHLLKWAPFNLTAGNANYAFNTYVTNAPNFSHCFNVQITQSSATTADVNRYIQLGTITAAGFNAVSVVRTTGATAASQGFFFAIGWTA